METGWTTNGNNTWYLKPVVNSRTFHEFIGAYGARTGSVYGADGRIIATLPSDLILDEALAAAKTIIMLNRNPK
jgi:hypothetical protein